MDLPIGEVRRSSPDYPILLNKIPDPPDPLYFVGDFRKNIFTNTLAVVGSRAVTMYGEWVVKNIVKEVARCGVTIVSGFMYGVDALSHQAALDADGTTVAVMAGGVDTILPSYQADMYFEIARKGLIVSEYKDEGAAGKWIFARRNRIVAGLAHAVLVVEAAEASGSLITARYAREYGRQLLTVPGNLTSKNAYGTTQLLKDGAKLVSCPDDILEIYFSDSNNYRHKVSRAVNKRLLMDPHDGLAQRIIDALYLEALSADELAIKLEIGVQEALKIVTGLCISGAIKDREGRYYVD